MKLLEQKGVEYFDIRREDTTINSVRAVNDSIKSITTAKKQGTSVRVVYKGAVGFAYSSAASENAIARKALAAAIALSKKREEKTTLASYKCVKADVKTSFRKNPLNVDISEKKDVVLSAIKDNFAGGISVIEAAATDITRILSFENSEGSRIRQRLTSCHIVAEAVARGARITNYHETYGGQLGFEATARFGDVVKEACSSAIELQGAKPAAGGMFPVVCDNLLTEVFIHEAVGHAAEADHLLSGNSCLAGKVGKKIGTDIVNFIVDPTVKGEWGSYFYDDEGIKPVKNTIIKGGILQGYMNHRESAAVLGVKPMGNGRAQGAEFLPLVRMSNTHIVEGDYSEEEVVKEVKRGYLLVSSQGGQVDPTKGNFHFAALKGYYIENGKIVHPVLGVSLKGDTLETLKSITAISKARKEGSIGNCGKGGQSVPTAGMNPYILIKKALVGGE